MCVASKNNKYYSYYFLLFLITDKIEQTQIIPKVIEHIKSAVVKSFLNDFHDYILSAKLNLVKS